MAKRYEFSEKAWSVLADPLTAPHGRGRPRLNDRLMLEVCSGLSALVRLSETCQSVSGLSQQFISGFEKANPRGFRSDAQAVAHQV